MNEISVRDGARTVLHTGTGGLGISLPLSFSLLPMFAVGSFGDETSMFPSCCSLLKMAAWMRDLPSCNEIKLYDNQVHTTTNTSSSFFKMAPFIVKPPLVFSGDGCCCC